MADLSDTIEQAAAGPASASVDGQAATARPIADLIAADRYLAAKSSASKRYRGLRFSKLLPAGPCSDQGASRTGSFDTPGGVV